MEGPMRLGVVLAGLLLAVCAVTALAEEPPNNEVELNSPNTYRGGAPENRHAPRRGAAGGENPPPGAAAAVASEPELLDGTITLQEMHVDLTADTEESAPEYEASSAGEGQELSSRGLDSDDAYHDKVDALLVEAEKATYGDDPMYPINYERAMEVLSEAEALGSHEAIYKRALIHQYGLGVPADAVRARALFEEAAAKGDASAQASLGFMYGSGVGGEKDDAKAVLHLYFGAMGGNPVAQLAMGYRHLHGIGVPQSCPTAALYYQPAAEITVSDHKETGTPPLVDKIRLDDDVDFRTVRNGEDDDIIQYYQYAADKGDLHAQVAMGQLYFFGARGINQNYARAHHYFQNAAQQGHVGAHAHLGHLYVHGSGVEASNTTALQHFREGAEKGDAASQNGLGFMYLHGNGVEKDVPEAVKYFKMAADKGNAEAQFNIGTLYVSGNGVDFDAAQALSYFSMATHQGHTIALFNLGAMYLNGMGTAPSCPHAVQYLKTVAEKGPWSIVFKDAQKYMRTDRFDGAFVAYSKLSEMGYEVAQHNAAWLVDRAYVQPPRPGAPADAPAASLLSDNATAFRYYCMAAEQGNVGAQVKIGDYYYKGDVVGRDYIKAAAHYRAATEQRNPEAAFNIGYMHEVGIGLPRDLHLAKRHYDLAAEYGEDAVVPATLALYKLRVNVWLEDNGHPSIEVVLARYAWDTWAMGGLSVLLLVMLVARRVFPRESAPPRPNFQ